MTVEAIPKTRDVDCINCQQRLRFEDSDIAHKKMSHAIRAANGKWYERYYSKVQVIQCPSCGDDTPAHKHPRDEYNSKI